MFTSYQLNDFTNEVEKELRKEAFKHNYYYENKYLKTYNQKCPLCKKDIKVGLRKILNKIGVVGIIFIKQKKLCVSYALCKQCSKKLKNYSETQKKECENIISNHICDC